MAGVEVKIDTTGLKKKIDRLAIQFNPNKLLNFIGQQMLFWINENFRQHGRIFTDKWPELSKNTIAGRAKWGGKTSVDPTQPLRDKGHLAMSVAYPNQGSGGIFAVSDSSVEVGTNVPYAKYHQFGTKGPYDIPKYRLRYLRDKRGRPYVVPLAFMTWDTGLIFRKKVRHPGIPARQIIPDEKQGGLIAKKAIEDFLDAVLIAARAKE